MGPALGRTRPCAQAGDVEKSARIEALRWQHTPASMRFMGVLLTTFPVFSTLSIVPNEFFCRNYEDFRTWPQPWNVTGFMCLRGLNYDAVMSIRLMPDLTTRNRQPELMDDPGLDAQYYPQVVS